jgi:hypothetical protein
MVAVSSSVAIPVKVRPLWSAVNTVVPPKRPESP